MKQPQNTVIPRPIAWGKHLFNKTKKAKQHYSQVPSTENHILEYYDSTVTQLEIQLVSSSHRATTDATDKIASLCHNRHHSFNPIIAPKQTQLMRFCRRVTAYTPRKIRSLRHNRRNSYNRVIVSQHTQTVRIFHLATTYTTRKIRSRRHNKRNSYNRVTVSQHTQAVRTRHLASKPQRQTQLVQSIIRHSVTTRRNPSTR